MQHKTSITVQKAINSGFQITNEWSNKEVGDKNISVVELTRGREVLVYVCDNASAEDFPGDFTDAIESVSASDLG